jgi:hypothetical protein
VNKKILPLTISAALAALFACGGPELIDVETDGYELFRAAVYQEPETGAFIVDGDIPIWSELELRQFYDEHVATGGFRTSGRGLIVNRVGASDDRWFDPVRLDLTYCVSTGFGGNYNLVRDAMRLAAADWERVTAVRFTYRASQDGNCTAANNSVVFDVNPVSGAPYLMRAFFPSYPRASRNVLIDSTAFGNIAPYSIRGILRHELGHVLGFRHEHTRPEAGTCFEDNNWRSLTVYDAGSVMHYPWCNGTNTGDLVLTALDIQGARALYGAANRYAFRSYNGNYVVAEGAGGSVVNANRTAIGPWEQFLIVPAAGGGPGVNIKTYDGWYVVAENGGGGAVNANRLEPLGWETFSMSSLGGSNWAIQASNGNYMVAEGGGGGVVNANRTAALQWETFTLIPQ